MAAGAGAAVCWAAVDAAGGTFWWVGGGVLVVGTGGAAAAVDGGFDGPRSCVDGSVVVDGCGGGVAVAGSAVAGSAAVVVAGGLGVPGSGVDGRGGGVAVAGSGVDGGAAVSVCGGLVVGILMGGGRHAAGHAVLHAGVAGVGGGPLNGRCWWVAEWIRHGCRCWHHWHRWRPPWQCR